MTPSEARQAFAGVPVARLATVTEEGWPHLVPVVFALDADTLFSAVDAKPKRTKALRRLANVATHPHVALLADHYEEDWSSLWWARADGTAAVLEPGSARAQTAIDLLAARYSQYREDRPSGPVLAVTVTRWSGWRASE